MRASSVVDRWGQYTGCQHLTDVGHRLSNVLPQRIIEDHVAPTPWAMMINGPAENSLSRHFLQPQRLSAEL